VAVVAVLLEVVKPLAMVALAVVVFIQETLLAVLALWVKDLRVVMGRVRVFTTRLVVAVVAVVLALPLFKMLV
jgi:hypothetical protein